MQGSAIQCDSPTDDSVRSGDDPLPRPRRRGEETARDQATSPLKTMQHSPARSTANRSLSSPLSSTQRKMSLQFDLPFLPDLELPGPALATPLPAHTRERPRAISTIDRRAMAKHNTNLTPIISTLASPRTRFDLSASPSAPVPMGSAIPLRPILASKTTAPRSPGREADITDSIFTHDDEYRLNEGERLPPQSPMFGFAPRYDDEPHPEHARDDPPADGRTPHPLYTPAPARRRRRRRGSKSVASNRTGRSSRSGRSARSRVKSAWRTVRRKGGRRRRSRSRGGGSSSSSSSSSSSTASSGSTNSSTGSGSSSRSSSTWGGWRFWRNSSSGSSSSSDSDSDSEWEPPTPHFTLLTPCLSHSEPLAYPSHLMPNAVNSSASTAATPSAPTARDAPGFDLLTTSTLAPVLGRLRQFWAERQQEDMASGDLGVGALSTLGTKDEESYFPDFDEPRLSPPPRANTLGASSASTPAVTPTATPGISTGGKNGRRGALATERRLGKAGKGEEGPAWWLDVMCPTVADMRELRKVLPLHPLTMEDILHQDTREKVENFAALDYYLIVFRALDESYFRYHSPDPALDATGSPQATAPTWSEADGASDRERHGSQLPGSSPGGRGRVEIVEGVGGKEGVEGVSVGAINMYLIVFPDGILTFHFEDITKHLERVQGKLQQFGRSRNFSSHWIAYGLMDSIVDAFFPLIDFIEGESNEVDTFLADPLNPYRSAISHSHKPIPSGLGGIDGQTVYDDQVVGIVVEPAVDDEKLKGSSASISGTGDSGVPMKKATILRKTPRTVLSHFPSLWVPSPLVRILPSRWVSTTDTPTDSIMLVDAKGFHLASLAKKEPQPVHTIEQLVAQASTRVARRHTGADGVSQGIKIGETKFDRTIMLKRLADSRKLVTGLSRLLAPKLEVIKGLRKRTKEENLAMFRGAEGKHDIAIYFGDLFDHIAAMQQSLTFYDAILSHDHPAYIGLLRLALASAKSGTDHGLAKLYAVSLTFLFVTIITGMFSLNVPVPHNGDRYTHLGSDGLPAGFGWFGGVIGIMLGLSVALWLLIYHIFKSSKKAHKKGLRHPGMGTQGSY